MGPHHLPGTCTPLFAEATWAPGKAHADTAVASSVHVAQTQVRERRFCSDDFILHLATAAVGVEPGYLDPELLTGAPAAALQVGGHMGAALPTECPSTSPAWRGVVTGHPGPSG